MYSKNTDSARAAYQAALKEHRGHVPVMIDRIEQLIAPAIDAQGENPVFVDATLGAGGHSERILSHFPQVTVVGLDRDADALREASQRLAPFGARFIAVHTRFDRVAEALDELQLEESGETTSICGALFDLGVSSMQLDRQERGFAYKVDAPLDMRMDQSQDLTAAEILNTYSHGELAHVLKAYGDERFAGKIAAAVIRERSKEPFTDSGRLVELLYRTIPAAARRHGGHPAKRTFQALRIEVNRELDALQLAIPAVADRLVVGGRAVFMSYQSLEDRIVKKAIAQMTTSTTPPGLPMDLPGTQPYFAAVTRGAEQATQDEIAANPRAASVRIRAFERTVAKEAAQ
ncbi:16S rRNA (cytosine(1402)-N(4))-methyltransferase RsmH [Corynebacterium atypicum]|uniref:16S rRNA (cytosine(1402)-N(4))-methyltransferase RsmH n=1 Tax=Corynebacterium atypicum TaxID=191610 RepID=UPI00056F82FA|nr:16S rRNA (cytosine(1402)-N(4))-methyltransferase RsmH [Corynebacterium atypicum]